MHDHASVFHAASAAQIAHIVPSWMSTVREPFDDHVPASCAGTVLRHRSPTLTSLLPARSDLTIGREARGVLGVHVTRRRGGGLSGGSNIAYGISTQERGHTQRHPLLSRDLYLVSAALSNVVPCLHAPLRAGTWSMKAISSRTATGSEASESRDPYPSAESHQPLEIGARRVPKAKAS